MPHVYGDSCVHFPIQHVRKIMCAEKNIPAKKNHAYFFGTGFWFTKCFNHNSKHHRLMKGARVLRERLIKADLPIWAYVAHGEAFGEHNIVWDKPYLTKIEWANVVNPDREPGVKVGEGFGFAGFDADSATYHRYSQCGSEHVMRVLAPNLQS